MPFDLSTAKPVGEKKGGFDVSSARPVGANQEQSAPPVNGWFDMAKRAYTGEPFKADMTPVGGEWGGPVQNAIANTTLEAVAGVNRAVTKGVDFLTTEPANAVSELAGLDSRSPSLESLLAPATQGGYMEPGLARDVVRGAGEVVPAAVGAGGILRETAQNLPKFTAASEGVISGILREFGKSSAAQDAGYGALSGVGAELGDKVGGTPGAFIGALAAPLSFAAMASRLNAAKQATEENVSELLRSLGHSPQKLGEKYIKTLVRKLNANKDYSQESILGVLEENPPVRDWVPKTRAEQQGIESNDFGLWRIQNEAAAGNHGSAAERQVNDFLAMRERQLGNVAQSQINDVGPTQDASSLRAVSEPLYEGILSKVSQAKQAKNDAYKAVDQVAAEQGPMMAEPQVMREGLGAAYGGFGGDIKLASQAETPKAYGLFKEIEGALKGQPAEGNLPGALAPVGNKMESLDNFESLRRRIAGAERAAERGSQDELLLGQVRRHYDEWLDKAVESGQFFGGPEQLAALKEARQLNREYMQIVKGTYKDGKPTARTKIINDVVNGRATPEQVVEQIVGAGGRKQSAQTIDDFKALFGRDSPEIGALRQAAFMKIFGPAIKVSDNGTIALSRGNYINRLSEQLKNNESNLQALFSEGEIKRWGKFADELKSIQEDVRKKNFSGSAYHAANMVGRAFTRLAEFGGRWIPFARKAAEDVAMNRKWAKLKKSGLVEGDFSSSPEAVNFVTALQRAADAGALEQKGPGSRSAPIVGALESVN